MMRRTAVLLLTLSVSLALTAPSAAAWDKQATRAAAARATEAFSQTSFVAKIPLGSATQYYVLPDGTPKSTGKRQGRGGDSRGGIALFSRGRVEEKHVGEGITVAALKDEIRVFLHRKRGKVLNAPVVHIQFDRETRPEDFDPHQIARAVSSVAEIRGFEPGSAVADALDAAIEKAFEAQNAAPPAVPTPAATGPTLLSLTVVAEPDPVVAGDEVGLTLLYEVAGLASGVAVTETRILKRADEIMPTFPAVHETSEQPGPVTSKYPQPLPASLQPGTYTFVGEVCVGDDCIRRSVDFRVGR